MSLKYSFTIVALIFFVTSITAQIAQENRVQEQEENSHSNTEWIPSMLNAGTNTLYNLIIYNGRIVSWNLRGESQHVKIIDGINWHSNIGQWSGDHLFMGMNFIFTKNEMILNGSFSNSGYFNSTIVNVLNTENSFQKKAVTISSNFTNTSNTNQSQSITFHTNEARIIKNTFFNFGVKLESAPQGVLPIGFKKSASIIFSLDKILRNNASIGLMALWNLSDQGRAATTTSEMFALSESRAYSPNWGWYHHQVYFPSTKQTNIPLITIRFQKKWNEQTSLNINNGIVFGKESRSNLTWTNTADPRPDYYKYLPSYISDTLLSAQLRDWYLANPQSLQINFDNLERINKASKEKRSFYIVNQENSALFMLHGSSLFSHVFPHRLNFQTGIQYAFDRFHFYNTIKDLLGGNFFYNYNGWMNDDSLATSFQNDITYPNKKIHQGEKWGADYTIQSFQLKPWIQLQRQGPIFENSIALGYGLEGLERNGFNENGLYANSKGSSDFRYFSTADLNGQLLYKLNGRIYFRSIVFAKWLAPNFQSILLDPDINANASSYVSLVNKYGADLSFFYRAPNFKTSLSVYHKNTMGESENKMFYHDAYRLFVYGVIGNMNSVQNGAELVIENNFIQGVKLSYAATFLNSYYIDNPLYQYLDVNNLQVKESGLLQLKNITKLADPRFVNAVSILYQPIYGLSIGLTTLYAQERSVAMNLFRRSDWVKNKLDPITWIQIKNVSMLDDQLVMNAFVTKFFQVKISKYTNKVYRFSLSASARNILNASIPIIAYEQTRFDYLGFNKEKFPKKYLMDAGASYSIRIQLQIQ
jgi:hypothetical protein